MWIHDSAKIHMINMLRLTWFSWYSSDSVKFYVIVLRFSWFRWIFSDSVNIHITGFSSHFMNDLKQKISTKRRASTKAVLWYKKTTAVVIVFYSRRNTLFFWMQRTENISNISSSIYIDKFWLFKSFNLFLIQFN